MSANWNSLHPLSFDFVVLLWPGLYIHLFSDIFTLIQSFRPVGNIQPWQQHESISSDIIMAAWSQAVNPVPVSASAGKENQPLKPICLTPVLPRTQSVLKNGSNEPSDNSPGEPLQTSTPMQPERPAFQSRLLVSSEVSAFRLCKPLQDPDRSTSKFGMLKFNSLIPCVP